MFTVTYFDSKTGKPQTETFGILLCAKAFASGLSERDRFRIQQVWDVYGNKPVDFPADTFHGA